MAYTTSVVEDDPLDACVGFDWDDGNLEKNWLSHRVAFWEAEEPFFNQPLILKKDRRHSSTEDRRFALGQTDAGRLLFVSFTIRRNLIRVISARDMTRRERRVYQHHEA
jgi:uncharacterized DUF497 family protein